MDNTRLLLFLALSLVTLLLWDAWQRDHAPEPQLVEAPVTNDIPAAPASAPTTADVPAVVESAPASAPTDAGAALPSSQVGAILQSGQRIHATTDVLDLEIDTVGGDVRIARLLAYPQAPEKDSKPLVLFTDKDVPLFVAQTGLLSDRKAPDHYATFSASQTDYELKTGQDELRVPLQWQADGVTVTKTFILRRGEYLVDVETTVQNDSAAPWQGRFYRQLHRSNEKTKGQSAFIYTYTGGVIYSDEKKYEKIKFEDMDDQDLGRNIVGGWAAMIQHYFLSAWVPKADQNNFFYTKSPAPGRYIIGMVTPVSSVASGASTTFNSELYVGPKIQDRLEEIAPGLDLTVDYGFLTVLAKPLFWLLGAIHGLVNNWGWAIVFVTMFIKLLFFPLSAASYRSMANMRKMQPKMMQIRERYGDDRQRMSQAMMELYKKEKINPFGGCLPILVQIPVFIALYWVLLESVELRQAPFILWINDLSTKDPFYVLPLLMGASMFIQQKLHPPPPDPVQAKVMMALPFVFTLFFAFFPSGLVLYWVVNNTLSIVQQWWINRKMDKAAVAAKA